MDVIERRSFQLGSRCSQVTHRARLESCLALHQI